MALLFDLCTAALKADAKMFGKLLEQAKQSQLDLGSRTLLEAVINSDKQNILDIWIQFRGEPTLAELEDWRDVADTDRAVAALFIICTKIIANEETKDKKGKVKTLGSLIQKHDSRQGYEFLDKHADIWKYR